MGAFNSLSEKLQKAFAKLTGKGRLTEDDVTAALKEVQIALLEADVNYKVVKDFTKKVKEKSIGKDVLESLTPGQQVIKIVNEELIELLGGKVDKLEITGKKPYIIFLVGLQGSGKTTTAGKLAYMIKGQNKKPFLIGADIYRPAAMDQLEVLAKKIDVNIHYDKNSRNIMEIVRAGIEYGKKDNSDVIIVDTAGRQHLDDSMMNELINLKGSIEPDEVTLVVDGMTGQDAVNIGKEFNEKVGVDSIAVTKMDGDARGGAVISLRYITGKQIKFIGMGEKIDQLELFYPDRIASRILGMGDILSLIEKAQDKIDEKSALELQKKLMEATFTLEDFLEQIKHMKSLGSIEDLLAMIPGGNKLKNVQVNEKDLSKTEAIILSMTKEERNRPNILNASRKKRISAGSGTQVQDINRLLKQFESTKTMMKQFGNMSKKRKGFGPKFF